MKTVFALGGGGVVGGIYDIFACFVYHRSFSCLLTLLPTQLRYCLCYTVGDMFRPSVLAISRPLAYKKHVQDLILTQYMQFVIPTKRTLLDTCEC